MQAQSFIQDTFDTIGDPQNIGRFIKDNNKFMIITGRRLDMDQLASGLALKEFLELIGKECRMVCAYDPKGQHENYRSISDVEELDYAEFDFANEDYKYIFQDGGTWNQYFDYKYDWREFAKYFNHDNFVLIDHHLGTIAEEFPENSFSRPASCTAEVLYFDIFSQFDAELTRSIYDHLYSALVGDTAKFSWSTSYDMYKLADICVNNGADHYRAVELVIPQKDMEFMAWALPKLEYFPELKLQLLVITQADFDELVEIFGESWNNYSRQFKFTGLRRVAGYDYGVVLNPQMNGEINISWRTRNYGETIEIEKVAKQAGFYEAGGHRNSGGGAFIGKLEDAKANILKEMRNHLQQANLI